MTFKGILNIARSVKDNGTLFLGDTRYGLEAFTQNYSTGDCVCRVTKAIVTFSSHAGTHADTPSHFMKQADRPLDRELYSGRAVFLNISGILSGVEIGAASLKEAIKPLGELTAAHVERVLLRTNRGNSYPSEPQEIFPYLGPGAVEFLNKLGTKVVYIDTPSVDAVDEKNLDAGSHGSLYRAGIMPVENIAPPNIPSCRCEIMTVFDYARDFADAIGIPAILFKPEN